MRVLCAPPLFFAPLFFIRIPAFFFAALQPLPCALMNSYFIINYQQWAGTMFFLTNKPIFSEFEILFATAQHGGGCKKGWVQSIFAGSAKKIFAHGQVLHPPFQIPVYAPAPRAILGGSEKIFYERDGVKLPCGWKGELKFPNRISKGVLQFYLPQGVIIYPLLYKGPSWRKRLKWSWRGKNNRLE